MTEKRKYSKKRRDMGEEAWAEYQRQRKVNGTTKYQNTKAERVIASRRKKKDLLVEYKGGKCERCGIKSEISDIYDFHHIDPTKKEFGISGKGKNSSLEALKQEADKCMLVCRNCHATIHYELNRARIKLRQQEALDFYNKKSNTNISIEEFIPDKVIVSKVNYKCIDCSTDLEQITLRCLDCHKIYISRNIPSKEQLEEDIVNLKGNMCAIGRKYGVSDNAVRKWVNIKYKIFRF